MSHAYSVTIDQQSQRMTLFCGRSAVASADWCDGRPQSLRWLSGTPFLDEKLCEDQAADTGATNLQQFIAGLATVSQPSARPVAAPRGSRRGSRRVSGAGDTWQVGTVVCADIFAAADEFRRQRSHDKRAEISLLKNGAPIRVTSFQSMVSVARRR